MKKALSTITRRKHFFRRSFWKYRLTFSGIFYKMKANSFSVEVRIMFGVMIDCSRNAVMKVPAVKEYVDILAGMGYDTLMLYTEDTYEVNDEPYFGYLRGRYSKDELKELDAYCASKGVELIPCIQTLAHLDAIFRPSRIYYGMRDIDNIALIDNERTYELVDRMFSTLSECFTTKKVHIGMDEAHQVGLGKYLEEHGFQDRFDLINRHLHKVCAIADKYGFNPMIWSDMFCKLARGLNDQYASGNLDAIREKAALPENVSLVYWDYYSSNYEHYVDNIRTNRAFDRPVVFAGGAWTWKAFAPDNAYSVQITKAAVDACRDQGINDMFLTLWGDHGGECSRLSVLPALFYSAEYYYGNSDEQAIKDQFAARFGMTFDEAVALDELNNPGGRHNYVPCKYLLYGDPFMGLNDWRITEADGHFYAALADKYAAITVSETFRDVFAMAEALARALAVKAPLGIRTRAAYRAGDKAALQKLAEEDYPEAIRLVERFLTALKKQWFAENKPFGFEVQDIRLGGLIQRLKSCQARLLDYASGEGENIPELEEALLENTGDKYPWSEMATVAAL